MNLELTGKRALVFGAGSGLGRAVALSLAAEGAHVLCAGRTAEKLQETVRLVEEAKGRASALVWDVTDPEVLEDRLTQAKHVLNGSVQVLFNNGGGPPPSLAQGQPRETWAAQYRNLVAPVIAVTDLVLPDMKAEGWGRVITNTSSGVIAPIPNLAMSNSLRGALVGWSKTLASEVAAQGITVNIVIPGRIATERTDFLDASRAAREGVSVEEVRAKSLASIPARRYGELREYGDVVAFLASTRASYITGSMVRIDGGAISSV
ncbi:MAG: hypothetical protein RLY30_857 [Pseudomonadota bacterium]|jgi:3-oxoacyl-[acyl-carrier protein] reductase